jgi:putative ABC transport system permease protein
MSVSSWGAALRIARRDAWRHRVRSSLIIAMVLIPVLGLASADILARTIQLSPQELISREIGTADVAFGVVGGPVRQNANPLSTDGFHVTYPPHHHGTSGPAVGTPAYQSAMRRALAAVDATDSTVFSSTFGYASAHNLKVPVSIDEIALTNPLTSGIDKLVSGRAPQTRNQVAFSGSMLHALGVGIGDQVALGNRSFTVTGTVRNLRGWSDNWATVAPGALPVHSHDVTLVLAKTPKPVSLAELRKVNAFGVYGVSAAVLLQPGTPLFYQQSSNLTSRYAVGVETVAVGMSILEVCLLAGAAFAVGARRQRRDLAVLSAAGGGPEDVRRVVLAGGLVLGVVGAVVGLGLAFALSPIVLPHVANAMNRAPGHYDVRPVELAGITLLGIITGLLSAVLPARSAARVDVVEALSGRRGVTQSARHIPLIGIAMIVLGTAIAYKATRDFHFNILLAGAVIAQLGFVLCASALVGLVARLGRYVGLAPRLALRDAARHRGRSGPAVAAIMSAVAGTIAISTYFVTVVHNNRNDYQPEGRVGQAALGLYHSTPAERARYSTVLQDSLGASKVLQVPTVKCLTFGGKCHELIDYSGYPQVAFTSLAVGDASLIPVAIGHSDPAASAALAAGKVVVFVKKVVPLAHQLGAAYDLRQIPGIQVMQIPTGNDGYALGGLITPTTAARLHAQTAVHVMLPVTAKSPSTDQIARASYQLPDNVILTVERGYKPGHYAGGVVILEIVAIIVMLGATAVSVGLSMAESKPHLVTLAAVGGRPLTRRLLVGSQAGVVSLLGAAQGLVAGLIPAWAVLHALRRPNFTLPWQTMLVIVIAIPLLSMIGTALFAGNRLTLDRRIG